MPSPSMALSSKAIPSTMPWSSCSGCWIVCTRTWRARPGGWGPTRSVALETTRGVWFSFSPLHIYSALQNSILKFRSVDFCVFWLLFTQYRSLLLPLCPFCFRPDVSSDCSSSSSLIPVTWWIGFLFGLKFEKKKSPFCQKSLVIWGHGCHSLLFLDASILTPPLLFQLLILQSKRFPIFFFKTQDGWSWHVCTQRSQIWMKPQTFGSKKALRSFVVVTASW